MSLLFRSGGLNLIRIIRIVVYNRFIWKGGDESQWEFFDYCRSTYLCEVIIGIVRLEKYP